MIHLGCKEGEFMVNVILMPSSFFYPNKVDEDLEKEYDAILETGLYEVVLFQYEAWFHENKLKLNRTYDQKTNAIYRGWMMKPQQYQQFYELLLEHNIQLITSPQQYERMHVFPNVYPLVKTDTPKMQVYPLYTKIDVEVLKNEFHRFMVKDYVKSIKGTDFPKFFDASITQEDFDGWMEKFYEYRGNLLTGGICIKEYVDLMKYGIYFNEYRVFYANHEMVSICRNSGQGLYTLEPPKSLLETYRYLDSPYYTIDYAQKADGSWIIIEAGDGSVSGLSDYQDMIIYYRALYYCLSKAETI